MDKMNEEIINGLKESNFKSEINKLSNDDLKRQVKNLDRSEVIRKLRSMGLGSVADRYANTSDDDIVKLISKNPDILRRINQFLK